MKRFFCLLISIFVIAAVGCGSSKNNTVSLDEVIKIANKNRTESTSQEDIKKYLYKYEGDNGAFTDAEVDMLTNFDSNKAYENYNGEKKITTEAAINDINYLFRILKYTYGGYKYFGGDKVFNAAKDNIIKNIKNYDSITANQMLEIIGQDIDFIRESHFAVDKYAPMNKHKKVYFYNEKYEFFKDEKGYYTLIDDKKYYLKSVEDSNNIEDYLKLSINSKGNLIYNFGLVQEELEPKTLFKIKFLQGKKELNKEVALKISHEKVVTQKNNNGFEKQIVDGIPIVKCRRMYDIDSKDNTCKLFAETGKELKNYPVSVIDIRGNIGGRDISSMEWFKGYTGKEIDKSENFAQLNSKISSSCFLKSCEKIINNKDKITEDTYHRALNGYKEMSNRIKNKQFNKWEVGKNTGSIVDNNNIIFVLIDKGVASSGESFVEYLRTLKNIVFVGTNTSGCSLIGGNIYCKLPNTELVLQFGTSLRLTENFEEGTGFVPDIWVNSHDALDRVIKLINNNKLKDKQ